jgi:hypothetical protein
VQTLFLTALFE